MRFSYYRRPLFLLLALYAGGLFLLRGRLLKAPAELPFALPRSSVMVEGRVAEYPAAAPGGARFQLETSRVYGRPVKAGLMVRASTAAPFSCGDTVVFIADLAAPRGAASPGALDWAGYLYGRGIEAEARAYDLAVTAPPGPVLRAARAFRARALDAFNAALGPEAGAVMGGVVLGEKRAVPDGLKDAFRDSGAMHLLVASGSNVGFVVAVVYFLCSRLRLGRRWSGAAALALAGFYVLAAGFDTPLVRAYLMFAAGLAAWMLRREGGTFHALTAAALAILLVSPRALFDAGFQMSFLAAYGLTVGISAWGPFLPRGAAGKAAGLLLVSLCAQLCLYPLLALYFHRISLASLFSNMVLVPASGLAMALGFLLAIFRGWDLVFLPLAKVSALFFGFFLKAVKFFAALPYASVNVPEPSALTLAGAFTLALLLLHAPLLPGGRRRFTAAAAAALGLALLAAGPLRRAAAGGERWRALLFGDRNTGCVLAETPEGFFLVNPGIGGKALADALLTAGGTGFKGVMLTCTDRACSSGLDELSRRVKVGAVLLPYGPRQPALARLLGRLEKEGAAVRRLWPGEAGPYGAACAWDAQGPGYTGRGDSFAWRLGRLSVTYGGRRAGLDCGPGGCGSLAEYSPGSVVELAPAPR